MSSSLPPVGSQSTGLPYALPPASKSESVSSQSASSSASVVSPKPSYQGSPPSSSLAGSRITLLTSSDGVLK